VTTIVYRDGVLAGDTRVTMGNTICPEVFRKVRRLADGSLFAAAGDLQEGELIHEALVKKLAMPKIEDKETEAIRIKSDGSIWHFGGRLWVRVRAPWAVLGSGYIAAMGALKIGATAIEAVRVARTLDVHTGGRIQTVKLRGSKK
jgi:hypothetical protein